MRQKVLISRFAATLGTVAKCLFLFQFHQQTTTSVFEDERAIFLDFVCADIVHSIDHHALNLHVGTKHFCGADSAEGNFSFTCIYSKLSEHTVAAGTAVHPVAIHVNAYIRIVAITGPVGYISAIDLYDLPLTV